MMGLKHFMVVNPALAVRETPVSARDRSALHDVFQNIHANSCPREYNFHMHTVCSDGRLQPEDLIQQAIALGLKGLAITDHHSVNGYRRAQQWLDNWQQTRADDAVTAPTLWSGLEVNAYLLDTEVHILAYAFDPEHPSIQPYLQGRATTGREYQADRAIAAIHLAGGLAILAHPARYRRSPVDLIPEAACLGIDGTEAFYAYNNPEPWTPSPSETETVRQLNDRHSLLCTCGTDTHGLSLLRRI
jgi:predicted metal-dependent phosphoesterase TrpH